MHFNTKFWLIQSLKKKKLSVFEKPIRKAFQLFGCLCDFHAPIVLMFQTCKSHVNTFTCGLFFTCLSFSFWAHWFLVSLLSTPRALSLHSHSSIRPRGRSHAVWHHAASCLLASLTTASCSAHCSLSPRRQMLSPQQLSLRRLNRWTEVLFIYL